METSNQSSKFSCIVCNFYTNNKCKYNEHMKTNKHLIKTGEKEKPKFICSICSKIYATKQSLWKHKQTCKPNDIKDENKIKLLKLSNKSKTVTMNTSEYEKLINQLREKDEIIRKQSNTVYFVTNNNITNNITNITDNRQIINNNIILMLNENCKESYNIVEWIRTIQVNLNQIVRYHTLNYSNVMSRLISDNLFCIPLKQRPYCVSKMRYIIKIIIFGKK